MQHYEYPSDLSFILKRWVVGRKAERKRKRERERGMPVGEGGIWRPKSSFEDSTFQRQSFHFFMPLVYKSKASVLSPVWEVS
jgi:hypothetical protein